MIKKFMVTFLSMIVFNLTPVLGSPTNQPAGKGRQQILKEMKGQNKANLSVDDEAAIKEKSKARVVRQTGQSIASTTDKIAGKLASSNFLTNILSLLPIPIPTAAIGLLNNVIGVVGKGVEAYALRKDALADMAFGKLPDLNDINEATNALENIEALTEIEEKMSGRKAIEKEAPNVSQGKKLFVYLNPSRLKNAMKRFTDDLHIANNQTKREEKIIQIREQIKKEEDHFDNLMKKLQSRFLNRLILGLMDALDKVDKIQRKELDQNTYISQLESDIAKAKGVLSSFENEIGKPKKKGILPITQNLKDLKAKKARQEIYVNKLTGRLEAFKEIWSDPSRGKQKLEALKKEMLELNPQKSTPAVGENAQKFEKRLETLEQEVSVLMRNMSEMKSSQRQR